MCGIAGGGFWGHRVTVDAAESAVASMVRQIAHRGPDGQGIQVSADARKSRAYSVLGHTRLAIIDVSNAGAQPMGTDAGTWVTFNGEIYNFATLRSELERHGASFRSHSDTEVLLRGYEVWGMDLLPRLRGMFAFALWDHARQQLLIARDRLGIKPVYWFRGDGFLLFASEVRALLASGLVPRALDATALWQYLGHQSIPAPRTLVANVSAMPPASWITIDARGEQASGTYWDMLANAGMRTGESHAVSTRLIGDKLRDAVSSHLVSDVPVGAFLSGGIDSSAVVALMRESGVQPRTFSVGFEERAFDESVYAERVAKTFDTEHTHIALTADDLLSQLPAALRAMDQPTGDAVNTYVVSGAVRARGLKVALSGLGGDEIFGGYPSFSRLRKLADVGRVWGKSPAALRSLAGTMVRAVGGTSVAAGKAAALLETDGEISSMFPVMRTVLSDEQRRALLSPRLVAQIDEHHGYDRLLAAAFDAHPETTTFSRVSYAEARTYMHDVLLRDTDQMSMAHALEVRVPLLDHELIELVVATPDEHKLSERAPKRLLVESLGGRLPDDIVHRPKQGFTLPFDPWMRGPLRALCAERLGPRGLAGRGIMDPAAIDRLWTSFLGGGRDVSWSRLWVLVVLDAWLDMHGVVA